jgi:hypothetical protein
VVSATNLDDYKTIRRSRVMVLELKAAIRILNLALRGLKEFNHYTPIKELIPSIKDCVAILEIHYNHHKQLLAKEENDG